MALPQVMGRYAGRRRSNFIATALSIGAAGFGLTWLFLILTVLVIKGVGGLNLAVFTEMTPPPGGAGGLLNAIVGSLILTVLAVLFGTPLGILAGTYMAEYGRYAKLTMVVRFINDILLSAPSIVVGLFVYEIMVAQMGHFSAWAGAVALAMHRHSRRGAHHRGHAAARAQHFARGIDARSVFRDGSSSATSPIAQPAPASSPASCSPSPASPAKPLRSCSPLSTTSSSAGISMRRWRACRW